MEWGFLGTTRNIDNLPMHTSNHPEYTSAVRKYIGGGIGNLVTNTDYAMEIAGVFRKQLSEYYGDEVKNISADSDGGLKGVNRYYQDIACNYLHQIHERLNIDEKKQMAFEAVVASGKRFALIWNDRNTLYELGYALKHGGLAAADIVMNLSEFRDAPEEVGGMDIEADSEDSSDSTS